MIMQLLHAGSKSLLLLVSLDSYRAANYFLQIVKVWVSYKVLSETLGGATLLEDDQNGLPKAYLNYLLYDSA